ncbi:MAG: respiratory nitrate reductase subunit gamma [Candidatus Zixiibacteriota bacterium]|nr:MAG: respiratory nitrate reductase subunit gamma [candidate division Zixibacteria bacterium]
MEVFAFFVGGILPYITVVLFIFGMGYRFYVWAKTPQPGRMTLFPAPDSLAGGVLAESLFFPSLFKGDKILWLFAWIFHATLALVFLGHIRVFTALIDRMLLAFGMNPEGIDVMSATAGGVAGVLLLTTGLLLLVRRISVRRVRDISGIPDFSVMILLIAIIVTGDLMRFGTHFDLEQTRVWTVSLLTFSPIVPPNGGFILHAFLAMILIIYIPYSKILHFGGIFFTQALVRRR